MAKRPTFNMPQEKPRNLTDVKAPEDRNPEPAEETNPVSESQAPDTSEAARDMAGPPMIEQGLEPRFEDSISSAKRDAERLDAALGAKVFPTPEEHVRNFRADLRDLSPEEQQELSKEVCWTIGKAAGHIPDYGSLTENMRAAYMKVVRDIFLYAQRKVRAIEEPTEE